MYIKPQYRVGSYIIGLLLGYYLAFIHKCTKQKRQESITMKAFGWTSASLACFWAIFGLYPALQVHSTGYVMMKIFHRIFFDVRGALINTFVRLFAKKFEDFRLSSGLGL